MILVHGNLWKSRADAICVTTNGMIRQDGKAVMGRGVALQAAQRYPHLPNLLAGCLRERGNRVFVFNFGNDPKIITFPTKHDWRDKSDIRLIKQSCLELIQVTHQMKRVALPLPGCSNGGLEVLPILDLLEETLIDPKFEVWDYKIEEDYHATAAAGI